MKLFTLAVLLACSAVEAGNITKAMQYAAETWNCDGSAPPCPGCAKVASGTPQSPYSCADWVGHVLAAGDYITAVSSCGDFDSYSIVGGYNLNVVSSEAKNLFSYLQGVLKWVPVSSKDLTYGTACAVDAGDGPWSHAVIGTGPGLCSYHNIARWDRVCDEAVVSYQLCLNPPAAADSSSSHSRAHPSGGLRQASRNGRGH